MAFRGVGSGALILRARPALAVALLLTVTAAGCGSDTSTAGVATVGRGDVTEVVEAPAAVTPRATVTLTAAADGTVASLRVRDGQQVKAGTLLMQVDSPSARRRLSEAWQADAQVAAAVPPVRTRSGVGAAQARADAQAARAFAGARDAARQISDHAVRAQALAALASAQSQYDVARASAQSVLRRVDAGLAGLTAALAAMSQAQRVQTRAAVAVAEQTVAALDVRAPIAGVVSLGGTPGAQRPDLSALSGLPDGPLNGPLNGAANGAANGSLPGNLQQVLGAAGAAAASGDTIAAGLPVRTGQPVVAITDVSALTLTAEVDETDVLLVRPGVAATVELDAVPGASYPARVASVDVSPAQSARGGITYRARLTLGGGARADGRPAPAPRPGMNAVVRLAVREARDALNVPASAVVHDGGREVVWVAERGRARQRAVVLGAQGEDRVQVVAGLRDGEQVVVRGADRVREGQQLRG